MFTVYTNFPYNSKIWKTLSKAYTPVHCGKRTNSENGKYQNPLVHTKVNSYFKKSGGENAYQNVMDLINNPIEPTAMMTTKMLTNKREW